MKILNHIAQYVPYTIEGEGEWYIIADSMIPNQVIITDRDEREIKWIDEDKLIPMKGFVFYSSSRVVEHRV